jgi:hypothetical protein
MKRLVVVLALVLAGGAARADKAAPPRLVTPPAGWVENTDQAKRVKSQLDMELMSEDATVEVYGWQPAERGALLLASLVTVEMPPERMGGWVREQIDEIHDTPAMMAGKEGKTRTISWSETADTADLEYANDELGTVSVVHVAWVRRAHADGAPDTIEEYKGECMVSSESAAQYQKPCAEAIAGLTLPAAAERLKIDTPARVAEGGDDDDDDDGSGTGSGTGTGTGTAAGSETGSGTGTGTGTVTSMNNAPEGAPLGPVITTKPASKGGTDMRPFWIAGGLLVLIAVLLWSRKKRQELIAEDERRKEEDEARAKAKKDKKPADAKKEEKAEKADKVAKIEAEAKKAEEKKDDEKAEEKKDEKAEEKKDDDKEDAS